MQDHFKNFPVMPGVLLLETLKQAASILLKRSIGVEIAEFRLIKAQDIRFGQFVKPGSVLKSSVHLKEKRDAVQFFEGKLDLMDAGGTHSKNRPISALFGLVSV